MFILLALALLIGQICAQYDYGSYNYDYGGNYGGNTQDVYYEIIGEGTQPSRISHTSGQQNR